MGFILFLALTAIISYSLRPGVRNALLLICSLVFYGLFGPEHLPFLIFSVLLTYFAARLIQGAHGGRRRLWLVLALCLNLGMLFVFKYLGFFVELTGRLAELTGVSLKLPELRLILPIGISFFVFQTTGYLIDVYRGKLPAERSLIDYGLFATFFPGLISGPIQRAGEMLPQYKRKNPFRYDNIKAGSLQFVWGVFLKLVIADKLGLLVSAAYASPSDFSGFQLLIAAVSYSIQIYCDFAAYSDMAIGTARVMGFTLPENFNCPYFAVSLQDFWRRWHISLSTWFRDYLYFPLGGNRNGKWRGYLNILIVFLISGLWHGSALTFAAWGLLHGLLQVVGKILKPARDRVRAALRISEDNRALKVFRIVFTFAEVTVCWVFFRAHSLGDALSVLGRIFSSPFEGVSFAAFGLSEAQLYVLLAAVLLLFAVDMLKKRLRLSERICRSYIPRAAVYVLLLCAIILFGHYGEGFDPMDFVYFKF